MKGMCISHRPYLIKYPGIANKKGGWGGGFLISTHCWLLKVSLIPEKDTGSPLVALMAAAGVNCTCILNKTEKGDDRSYGLI